MSVNAFTLVGVPLNPMSGRAKEDARRSLQTQAAFEVIADEKKAVTCTIVSQGEGTPAGNVTGLSVQFKDRNGDNITYRWVGTILCLKDNFEDINAGTTGLVEAADGAIIATIVAKGAFLCTSELDGSLSFTYGDVENPAEEANLGVVFDGGYLIWSGDIAPVL